jgi:uncharacterized membrane protein
MPETPTPTLPGGNEASLLVAMGALERRVVEGLLQRRPTAEDSLRQVFDRRTFGERVSDGLAAFGGSWTFVIAFVALLAAWMLVNTWLLHARGRAFDPYPFILLNLVLSTVAALQAPVILMSQNRSAARDRRQAQHDYEVNLRAELEVRMLHEKLDELREAQWGELVRQQREQLALLERLLGRDGAAPPSTTSA